LFLSLSLCESLSSTTETEVMEMVMISASLRTQKPGRMNDFGKRVGFGISLLERKSLSSPLEKEMYSWHQVYQQVSRQGLAISLGYPHLNKTKLLKYLLGTILLDLKYILSKSPHNRLKKNCFPISLTPTIIPLLHSLIKTV